MKKLIVVLSFMLTVLPAMAQNHTDYKLPDEPKRAKYVDYSSLNRGFWFAVQATPFYYLNGSAGIQGDLILGYRGGEFFKIGPGISVGTAGNLLTLPVYLDIRGNIISQESRMVVPYWSLDAGWNLAEPYKAKGLYVSPTAGVRVGMPRNDFIAGLTYIFQMIPDANPIHAVGLRIGFEF